MEFLNNSVVQGNLSYNMSLFDVERNREAGYFTEHWRKVAPQLGLGAVFIMLNCVIVTAMWRKPGKRLSNYSLLTILFSSVLFSLFPLLKSLKKNGHCNTAEKCALYGMVTHFTVMYTMTSGLGVLLEMTHASKTLKPSHIHCRILLLSFLIACPGTMSYKLQIARDDQGSQAVCARANIMGSNTVQIMYHLEFFVVSIILPRIYIVYVWYRCGFKLKLLGVGKRLEGALARKVNQVRWTFLFTVCYFFLFVPAPVMKAVLQAGITINMEKSEGLDPWNFGTLLATYMQSLLQPILLLYTYSYVPFSQLCGCRKAKKTETFEMTFLTNRTENVTFENA